MSAPAYLPLFGSDYLADTRHLSTEEHGAYLLLMIAAWRQDDCGLPNDDKKLARIVGLSARKWAVIKDTILEFWTLEAGRIFQARLRKERGFADQKSDSNRRSARARWGKQTSENIGGASCERISERNAPQPQPQIEEPKGPSIPLTPPVDSEASPGGDQPAEKPKRKPAAKRSVGVDHPMPEGWQPILTAEAQRTVDGWPPGLFETQVAAFRDHAADKGRLSKDWQAAFRTWISKTIIRNPANDRCPPTGRQPASSREGDGYTRALDLVDAALAEQRAGGSSWAS